MKQKRLLLDLNVLLDVVLDREGAPAMAQLWTALETGAGHGCIPAHGVTTIFYVVAKARGGTFAGKAIAALMDIFPVVPVDGQVLRSALALEWPDFEDAVCAASAEAAGCDALVTRDPRGFKGGSVPVLTPTAAFALLSTR